MCLMNRYEQTVVKNRKWVYGYNNCLPAKGATSQAISKKSKIKHPKKIKQKQSAKFRHLNEKIICNCNCH